METAIERFGFGRESTLGEWLVEEMHECFCLEDERRTVKVDGHTCIPVGRYEIKLRAEGPTHERFLIRFPGLHQGMLHIVGVPGFSLIQIHPGNDNRDTDGCPLPGRHPVLLSSGEFKVADSVAAYLPLYRKIVSALGREKVFLTVRERNPV